MLYLGLVASRDSHQVIAVTGSASTLIQLGLTITDNRANMFVVQPDGGDIRYCVNGIPNTTTPSGFIGNNQLYITLTRDEATNARWILSGTASSKLQVGSFVHQGFPQIY